MISFICFCALLACVAAFVVTLLYKWRVIEYLQIHGNTFFSKMANCDFCLSWWVCVLLVLPIAIYTGDYRCLFAPFVSTIITRNLL